MVNIEAGGEQFVHCRASLMCPLLEVPLYAGVFIVKHAYVVFRG